jgi:hypothetical protein
MRPRGLAAIPRKENSEVGSERAKSVGGSDMSGVNRFVGCLSTAAAGLALGAPSALAESTSAAPAGGFDASSVSGAPEGLAVYQNGMRIHEALGNTANWDLTPTTAVRTIDVISNNPAFGLNALGGARNIQMKDAFTFDGPVSLRTTGLYMLDTFDVTNAFSVSAGGRLNVANIQLQDQLGSSLNETICLCTSIR